MKVRVKLQGTLPDHYQGTYPETGLEIESGTTMSVADLVARIGIAEKKVALVSINGRLARPDDLVPDGAVVKFLQQLSGG